MTWGCADAARILTGALSGLYWVFVSLMGLMVPSDRPLQETIGLHILGVKGCRICAGFKYN